MPYIDVSCQGSMSEGQRRALAEELTRVALEAEGLPDNPASRAIAVVTFRDLGRVFVGGQPDESPRFKVFMNALSGALEPEQKMQVHAHIRDAFQKACPELLVRGGANVWSVLNEIENGAFGVAGSSVSIQVVRSLVTRR